MWREKCIPSKRLKEKLSLHRCWVFEIRVEGTRREVIRFAISTACTTILNIVRKVKGVDCWERFMVDSFIGGVDDDDTMMELI